MSLHYSCTNRGPAFTKGTEEPSEVKAALIDRSNFKVVCAQGGTTHDDAEFEANMRRPEANRKRRAFRILTCLTALLKMLIYRQSYLQPDLSPDGRYASFVSLEIDTLLSLVEVVDVETGEMVPFRIEVPSPLQSTNIIFGRTRWLPDGSAVAWVGIDEQGRSGIYAQDFVPGKDTSATRRALAGFSDDYTTESFGISPDGTKITLATLEQTIQLMLAEDVPGVSRGSAR